MNPGESYDEDGEPLTCDYCGDPIPLERFDLGLCTRCEAREAYEDNTLEHLRELEAFGDDPLS